MIRPWRLLVVMLIVGELMSLVWLGQLLGFFGTLAYLLLSGVVGVQLIRASGSSLARVVAAAQTQATAAAMSEGAAASMLKAVAGLLVLVPGLVSDAAALLLLLPATRRHVAKLLPFNLSFTQSSAPGWQPPGQADATIIEGEAVEIIEPDKRLR